jgi:hypothetical protein
MKEELAQVEFLKGVPDSLLNLRADLWDLYQFAVRSAHELNARCIGIVRVSVGGPSWKNGVIEIPLDPDNMGVIFHEVGHSFFEGSVFHTSLGGGHNDWWGDAFCDAFRYCLEKVYCPTSVWLTRFPNDSGGRYQGPADRILTKCITKDFAGFRKLWQDLVARFDQSPDFFNREFGYDMPMP